MHMRCWAATHDALKGTAALPGRQRSVLPGLTRAFLGLHLAFTRISKAAFVSSMISQPCRGMRLFCAVAVLCLCSTAFAFCVTPHRSALTTTAAVRPHSCSPWTSSRTALHMAKGKKKEAAAEDDAKADTADSKKSKGKQEVKAEEAPVEEPKEEAPVDPNAEIKAEIKELEAAVRTAEKRHAAAQESIKERGKTGYLRLAAEVDNYRKRRNLDRDGLQREAVVRALKSFVPVMEGFETAEALLTLETESEQKFSSNYQSLYRQHAAAVNIAVMLHLRITCSIYNANSSCAVICIITVADGTAAYICLAQLLYAGETFNFARHEKVGEESSSDIKAGAVISCSTKGMEIKGSVIRKAKVVVSLGPEAAAVSKEESADAIDTANDGDDSAAAADAEE
eukprot:11464-Heterococcus_DN1.PRE.2